MTNQLIFLDEVINAECEAHGKGSAQAVVNGWSEARNVVHARLQTEFPIHFGVLISVNYDAKSDRYTAKFDGRTTVRVSTDVAEFLLLHRQHGTALPTINGTMTNGIVDAVAVIFLSK